MPSQVNFFGTKRVKQCFSFRQFFGLSKAHLQLSSFYSPLKRAPLRKRAPNLRHVKKKEPKKLSW